MAVQRPARRSARKATQRTATNAPRKITDAKRGRTPANAEAASFDRLRIRMYRLGIGDCFLLTLPGTAGAPFHLLIDCGTHNSERTGPKDNPDPWRTEAAAADIAAVTAGRLDAVVGTHEHWDHLSGFLQGKAAFESCEAAAIWCSWAEDVANEPIARELVGLRNAAQDALWTARTRLDSLGPEHAEEAAALRDRLSALFGFFGESPGVGERARDAAEALRALGRDRVRYLSPGAPPIEGPGGDWRIFVLGPPRDLALLRRDQPRQPGEGYPLAGLAAAERNLAAVAAALGAPDCDPPFKASFQIPLDETRGMAFFQQRYWHDAAPGAARGEEPAQDFRRIGLAHLGVAEAFALKHDRLTNNTSLVLALELGPPTARDNPVVLFAGDAQIGNWLSWRDVVWPDYHGRRVDGADLLARTEIYKVGHHASHNATLMEGGLEAMHRLRVALVTVSQATATKLHWEKSLPRPSILMRLAEVAREAVIRSDAGIERRPGTAAPTITLCETELYVDIELAIAKF
ncbi:MBL fold metallo-hydrolase [Roseomonas stagni]|uniref:MBL fold metallo-hydrolase n=1 Tax=Falsiroseomonas algicola TaxID=2716930 RepID=A0A6M1LWX5_9PROT|nr:MBL fold metallo-hydrolase [Falsiroseomonas algicola]NGM23984.1 MBL fold metallo-hydrolase [Falsiroseomonas algicola]